MTKSHETPTRDSMVFHASDGCDVRHETEGALNACEDKATAAPKGIPLPGPTSWPPRGSPLNLRLDPDGSKGRAAAKRERKTAQEPKITIRGRRKSRQDEMKTWINQQPNVKQPKITIIGSLQSFAVGPSEETRIDFTGTAEIELRSSDKAGAALHLHRLRRRPYAPPRDGRDRRSTQGLHPWQPCIWSHRVGFHRDDGDG